MTLPRTSGDEARAIRVAQRFPTVLASVNSGMATDIDLPFGSYEQSGISKGRGLADFAKYLETEALAMGAAG